MMKGTFVHAIGWCYRNIGAPVFYLWDSEPIHDFFLNFGEVLASMRGITLLTGSMMRVTSPTLESTVAGITFKNPVGLAAGFDHEAQLPGIIGAIGFGFESVGTVTNGEYGGNPYPRIKRLVKSKAILVNKGFKSTGVANVLRRLKDSSESWQVPIGISLGRTNTQDHNTHEDAIEDIVTSFRKTKDSLLPFSYYELNISCPNLLKDIPFYTKDRLTQLLTAIFALKLEAQPFFIKMPIGLPNDRTLELLDVCMEFPVSAVIFGNLQHDRTHPTFDKAEIEQYADKRGNWSGMPCQARSDELVLLACKHLKGKIAIIGCGGIFNAEDAYRKIKNGASLVQLVSATIFEGPQIAAEICADLPKLLEKDGYKNISEAVGANAR